MQEIATQHQQTVYADYVEDAEVYKNSIYELLNVRLESNSKHVAVKRVKKEIELTTYIYTEVERLKAIDHSHILKLERFVEYDETAELFFEHIPHGNVIRYFGDVVDESGCKLIARQALEALSYLHKHSIVHGNLKPENIIVDSVNPLPVKLSDFGLSRVLCGNSDDENLSSQMYISPYPASYTDTY